LNSKPIMVGTAGEHLACYDAFMNGYYCTMTSGSCTYDLVLENGKPLRVQVKSSTYSKAKNRGSLQFNLYRRNSMGNALYDDIDLWALVDVNRRMVAWLTRNELDGVTKFSIQREEFMTYSLIGAVDRTC